MVDEKNLRMKEVEISKKNWFFEKEINLAWIVLHNWNWFQINELYILIFYEWLFTLMSDEIYWKLSLLTGLSCLLSLILLFL